MREIFIKAEDLSDARRSPLIAPAFIVQRFAVHPLEVNDLAHILLTDRKPQQRKRTPAASPVAAVSTASTVGKKTVPAQISTFGCDYFSW